MQNLLDELKEVLRQDDRFIIEGRLAKNKVVEHALKLDESLLTLLLSSERLREHFFQRVGDNFVFDKQKFQRFVTSKQFLPDSYTAFKNKIGLAVDGQYLADSKEVELVWPFKDCVLEGGQTKEDQKRKEIFWNTTLAPDEIDRLLSPKVLTNFKRYDAEGGHKADNLSIKDNLIIKGNNLLALESLKNVYAGRVKLIYIDPPYNTGNDEFGYNDSFNHSTWLTFIKNRLEVAHDLLSTDGSLWINIDDHQLFALKVLCDEIFGSDNFVGNVIWQHSVQGKGYAGKLSVHHNYILSYQKTEQFKLGLMERTEKHNKHYKNPDNDPNGPWRSGDIRNALYRPNLIYDIKTPSGKVISPPENGWRFSKETMNKKMRTGEVSFNEDESKLIYKIYLKDQKGRVPETIWFSDEVGTTRTANSEIKALFGKKIFDTPKPESLLQRILNISTNENDLVLDFCSGSGTTGAVAHKMNRQYILCEQMEYVKSVTVERAKKVIGGEQGGISEDVDWKGGGSFIYTELKKANAEFSDSIEEANSTKELEKIWEQMQKTGFISYRVDPKSINENKSDFEQLTLDEQKQLLIELLDKNQLYVNYSEIESEDHEISKEEIELNHKFYNLGSN